LAAQRPFSINALRQPNKLGQFRDRFEHLWEAGRPNIEAAAILKRFAILATELDVKYISENNRFQVIVASLGELVVCYLVKRQCLVVLPW
jgi:hypothetical protein